MKSRLAGNLSKLHLATDIALLNISYLLSSTVILGSSANIGEHKYLNLVLLGNLIWILCVKIFDLYSFTRISYNSLKHFGKLLLAVVCHFALSEIFVYLSKDAIGLKETMVFVAFEVFVILSFVVHVVFILTLQFFRKSGFNQKRYAIIGQGELTRKIEDFYDNRKELGYQFCGTYDLGQRQVQEESLENFMETQSLDYIYCAISEMNKDQIQAVVTLAERKKTQVRLIPDFGALVENKLRFESHDEYPVINVDTKPMSNADEQFIKRTFDLAFSSVVMILGLPVFLCVMLLVKLTSKGSIFFLQERTGRWGKSFKIIKFRTMYMDAHKYGLKHSLGAKDPRITPIGYFLRRTRLDELPQFLNVLKGDMSVVGPRPLHKFDVDMLMEQASHDFQKMLTIRPGITSIGQIKVGYATNTSENLHRLKYDILYLQTYSLRTDLYLILMTIQVVLLGKGR